MRTMLDAGHDLTFRRTVQAVSDRPLYAPSFRLGDLSFYPVAPDQHRSAILSGSVAAWDEGTGRGRGAFSYKAESHHDIAEERQLTRADV